MPVQMPKLTAPSPTAGIQAFTQMLNALSREQLQNAQTQRLNIQNQYLPQMMQEQLTRAQVQNQFLPLMQQEQLRQMQFKNAFQQLVNQFYPDLTGAKITQLNRTGQFASLPPLGRAFQLYQNYSQSYGENDARTQEAKKIYNSMMNSANALTQQRSLYTQLAPFKSLTKEQKLGQGLMGLDPVQQQGVMSQNMANTMQPAAQVGSAIVQGISNLAKRYGQPGD